MLRDRSTHGRGNTDHLRGILHVEDDPITRETVRGVLSGDHEVVSASGLTQALDFARDREFALYLLGGMFRDGSSLELCYELRLLHPSVPVILHSQLPGELGHHLLVAGATEIVDRDAPVDSITDAVRRNVNHFSPLERSRTASSAG